MTGTYAYYSNLQVKMNCLFIVIVLLLNSMMLSSFCLLNKLSPLMKINVLTMELSSEDPSLRSFLKGNVDAPWKGTTDSLKRRKQIPLPEYDPRKVVQICLDALQVNDEPQLDHGCCVLLSFKSPNGPIAQGGLDPAGYGRFLRSTDYSILIDHASSELVGNFIELKDSLSVKQTVQILGWRNTKTGIVETKLFDFYLTNVSNLWLLDVILLNS